MPQIGQICLTPQLKIINNWIILAARYDIISLISIEIESRGALVNFTSGATENSSNALIQLMK
jgi:hypothetical protein